MTLPLNTKFMNSSLFAILCYLSILSNIHLRFLGKYCCISIFVSDSFAWKKAKNLKNLKEWPKFIENERMGFPWTRYTITHSQKINFILIQLETLMVAQWLTKFTTYLFKSVNRWGTCLQSYSKVGISPYWFSNIFFILKWSPKICMQLLMI